MVTVAVATFFSADFVLETLESIYHQTYQDISLIISDDCSTDDTVAVVNKWVALERVKNRFDSIQVLTVPKNTGVSANCNRCIAASTSDWIKFIAADDILLPNCIADNIAFVTDNPNANVVFSQVKMYQDTFEEKNYLETTPLDYPNNLMHESLSAKGQYQLLLVSDRIHYTPSLFLNKQAILKVGGYDETCRLVEDYPMWLKLTGSGERLYYFHKITVGYRIHSKAANNVGEKALFKPSAINGYLVRKKYAHPYLPKLLVLQENWAYHVTVCFKKIGIIKKTKLNFMLYKFMIFYANPFFYCNALYRKLK